MNFLQAHAALKAFSGGPVVHLLLAMSGTGDPLELYVRATAASRGYDAHVSFLPFGTLRQALLSPRDSDVREVFLLFPWDLVPAMDWRTGVAETIGADGDAREQAEEVIALLSRRGAALIYVDAPGAPLWLDPHLNRSLHSYLRSAIERVGGKVVDASLFAIGSYLATGQPVSLKHASVVAGAIVDAGLQDKRSSSAKVLVTDLDHTLWHGIVGDDGVVGLHFRPEGKGYRHFVYQSMLRRLRADGVLLAAVSKNDEAMVKEAFAAGDMVLNEDDFVAIIASWEPKSAQIELLAERLNLGLDSFVFVDDNPVEIAEVSERLPLVACVHFPVGEEGVALLVHDLVQRFQRTAITAEDRERTGLYKRRVASLPPREASPSDIRQFLRKLEMTLSIKDRSGEDRSRAVQLINKTNQFNLNGERLADSDVERRLEQGDRLFTASLADSTGEHGEILAALVTSDNQITHLVMSCRVFQRRVEFAFLAWLMNNGLEPSGFVFRGTDRNRPLQQFLELLGTGPLQDGVVSPDLSSLREQLQEDLSLFVVPPLVGSQ